ncbi:MAG TPA: hypothetical protein VMJ32_09370 [Pirellulales bacterium]|nr:hypothetical protein [Pirellulales bacterium]
MKTGYFRHVVTLSVLALLLPASGCFSNYKNRVNQQLWERELRLQEDCIYRLRWELEDKQRELDEANARANSLNKQTDILRGNNSSGPDLGPPPPFTPSPGRGTETPGLPPAPPSMPEVQPGKPFTPSSSSTRESNSSVAGNVQPEPTTADAAVQQAGDTMLDPAVKQADYTAAEPMAKRASYSTPGGSEARPMERLNPDTEVESIELNDGLTGEMNSTGQAGGGYLNVVIQQRDSHGKRVLAPGDVSIVVVDPALEGSAARIARWDFDADAVPQHVRRNHDGASLQFELPWQTPPAHSDLRVFVRFTTFDGRRLEANLPIDVQVAGGDSGPRDWKKSTASSSPRSAADAFADADPQAAAGADRHDSVYQPDDGDAGPALTAAPLASQPTPAATPSGASNDKPLLDASRRPVWSPYR